MWSNPIRTLLLREAGADDDKLTWDVAVASEFVVTSDKLSGVAGVDCAVVCSATDCKASEGNVDKAV